MIRLALMALALAGTPFGVWAAAPPCTAAADLDTDGLSLPHVAAVLKPGATLSMLAIGSGAPPPLPGSASPAAASVAPVMGKAGGKPAPAAPAPGPIAPAGLPWQVAHALEATVHGLHVGVTEVGHRGMTAEGMLGPMRDALAKKQYRLVLWLTGTVDAVNSVPPDDFYEALADGAAAATNAGADLVLVDPQYSRFLEANANLEPYAIALRAVGALPGVALFHRFDIMKDWADDGAIDLERTPKADRPAAAARLHVCLGRELARMLVQGPAQ
jgi:acyl-CoA thioesterase I